MLPVVIRTTEEMVRLVPSEQREASYALGSRKAGTIGRIVVPVALPGIVSGALLAIARAAGAPLVVDDAHGTAVLRSEGRGSPHHYGPAAAAVPILMGTLGKALGTFGAFVAGSEDWIETLIQSARSYIYTTAPPPALAAATRPVAPARI